MFKRGESSWWRSPAFFTCEGTEVNLQNSSLMEARFGESEETNVKIMTGSGGRDTIGWCESPDMGLSGSVRQIG